MFRPRRIAVIGASAKPASLGNIVFQNLRTFHGPVHPVNPRGGEIAGHAVHTTLGDLPEPADLAVIVTPPDVVAGIVKDLGAAGCKAAAGSLIT